MYYHRICAAAALLLVSVLSNASAEDDVTRAHLSLVDIERAVDWR